MPGMGRREVDVSELRERLGVCLDAMRDPPPPWLKMKSRSEDPGAYFYQSSHERRVVGLS